MIRQLANERTAVRSLYGNNLPKTFFPSVRIRWNLPYVFAKYLSPCLSQEKGREKGINLHFLQKIFLWFPNFAVRLAALLLKRGHFFFFQFSRKLLIGHELWNIPNIGYYVTANPTLLRIILSKIGCWIKIFGGSVCAQSVFQDKKAKCPNCAS